MYASKSSARSVLTHVVLRRRGPDDAGLYLDHDVVGFGFRRLSMLDLSPTGHQPMSTDDGQLVLVFNGEIYNCIQLRDELRAAGRCFRSPSDAEVPCTSAVRSHAIEVSSCTVATGLTAPPSAVLQHRSS